VLEAAAREDQLKSAKGLGAAMQRKIIEGLNLRETALGTRHLHRADELALSARSALATSAAAGNSFRTWLARPV
jgi:DNA polymerase (family 10)